MKKDIGNTHGNRLVTMANFQALTAHIHLAAMFVLQPIMELFSDAAVYSILYTVKNGQLNIKSIAVDNVNGEGDIQHFTIETERKANHYDFKEAQTSWRNGPNGEFEGKVIQAIIGITANPQLWDMLFMHNHVTQTYSFDSKKPKNKMFSISPSTAEYGFIGIIADTETLEHYSEFDSWKSVAESGMSVISTLYDMAAYATDGEGYSFDDYPANFGTYREEFFNEGEKD